MIVGPDGFKYKIVEPVAGAAERFVAVALRCADAEASRAYWCDLLGMTALPTPPGLVSSW